MPELFSCTESARTVMHCRCDFAFYCYCHSLFHFQMWQTGCDG